MAKKIGWTRLPGENWEVIDVPGAAELLDEYNACLDVDECDEILDKLARIGALKPEGNAIRDVIASVSREWNSPYSLTDARRRDGSPVVRIDSTGSLEQMRYQLRLHGLRTEIVSGEDRYIVAFECDHQSEAADEVRRLVATHDLGVASDLALDCAERGWTTIREGYFVIDAISAVIRGVREQWWLRMELHSHLARHENARRATEITEQAAKQDQDASYVPVRTYQ
jgi:hypothetical protein